MSKKNHFLYANARTLRKRMTPEERKLWYDFLRYHPFKFRRQKVIGRYIVDFYCAKIKLVIEVDGDQHFTEKGVQQDQIRTEELNRCGLYVLRISNEDIQRDFDGICRHIEETINTFRSRAEKQKKKAE